MLQTVTAIKRIQSDLAQGTSGVKLTKIPMTSLVIFILITAVIGLGQGLGQSLGLGLGC